MRTSACTIVLVALLCAACSDATLGPQHSDLPKVPVGPPSPAAPAASSSCGLVAGPARVYNFSSELEFRVREFTRQSRFVLYENGTFVLEYASPIGQYCGRYTESNGAITFTWDGWSTAGEWGAKGIVKDRAMTVTYNSIMMMSDFEDAIYSRIP